MTDVDALIREARERDAEVRRASDRLGEPVDGTLWGDLADALEASNARADQLEKALREARADVRAVYYEPWDSARRTVAEAALVRIDAALAGVTAEPATEEKHDKDSIGEGAVSLTAEEGPRSPTPQGCADRAGPGMRAPNPGRPSSVSAGAGQVPADTIEKALQAARELLAHPVFDWGGARTIALRDALADVAASEKKS